MTAQVLLRALCTLSYDMYAPPHMTYIQVSPAEAEEALYAAVEKCLAVNPDLRSLLPV